MPQVRGRALPFAREFRISGLEFVPARLMYQPCPEYTQAGKKQQDMPVSVFPPTCGERDPQPTKTRDEGQALRAPHPPEAGGGATLPALRTEPQNSGAHNPKADILVPIVGTEAATNRRPSVIGRIAPTPAAKHAVAAGSRPRGIRLRRIGVRAKPVIYPLPHDIAPSII